MKPRLQLFGAVSWNHAGDSQPVRGRTRSGMLLALAEQQGHVVSVASMLDRFWSEPPMSGSNAVQRHISALRRELADLGVAAPGQVIEHVAGGYRLTNEVLTDLSDPVDSSWWLEPIVGARWELHPVLRARLERLALVELERWIRSGESSPGDLANRVGSMLQHHSGMPDAVVETATGAVVDFSRGQRREDMARSLLRLLNERSIAVPTPLRGFERPIEEASTGAEDRLALRQIIGLWGVGRVDDALDALDARAWSDEDFHRRLCRALIWQEHGDGGNRLLLDLLAEDAVVDVPQSERTLITIDANSLNLMADGAEVSRREIAEAATLNLRLRCLRTEFMRRLAHPRSADDDDVVQSIEEIDLADAAVEAARFRFILHLRDGLWEQARDELGRYGKVVSEQWAHSGDDFETMAVASLQRALDSDCARTFGSPELVFGRFSADPWLLDVAEAGRRLLLSRPDEPLTDVEFHRGLGAVRANPGQAFRLLRDMASGRPVMAQAEQFAELLRDAAPEKQYLYAPVALGRIAETMGSRDLAATAMELLMPWSGQVLGMWPVDLVLGRADVWLDRLADV